MSAGRDNLTGFAVFGGLLAAAGLPIYIHAPKFYVDEYAVSLGALGTILFVLRLLDFVQDPLLGILAEKMRRMQGLAVAVALGLMALGMVGLFALEPRLPVLWWFGLTLALVFSSFSFLTIVFYARGVSKAEALGGKGHLRLARWRETGALLGVCLAAVAPTVLAGAGLPAFAVFALGFALAALIAGVLMRREWRRDLELESGGFGPVLRDPIARRLLIVALANAAPVAVTSTLFLFYVEARLGATGWEGPLLLLFFLAAAGAAPLWGRLAERIGAKRALMWAMVLAILAFSVVPWLGTGDTVAFAVICLASGAALGADMTLLPAIFATRMETVAPNATEGFSLWSFVSKFTLAFAAIALLPALEALGFQPSNGTENDPRALLYLSLFYALVPCVLKLFALALLWATPLEES